MLVASSWRLLLFLENLDDREERRQQARWQQARRTLRMAEAGVVSNVSVPSGPMVTVVASMNESSSSATTVPSGLTLTVTASITRSNGADVCAPGVRRGLNRALDWRSFSSCPVRWRSLDSIARGRHPRPRSSGRTPTQDGLRLMTFCPPLGWPRTAEARTISLAPDVVNRFPARARVWRDYISCRAVVGASPAQPPCRRRSTHGMLCRRHRHAHRGRRQIRRERLRHAKRVTFRTSAALPRSRRRPPFR